jgi:uncharacterized protein (TIGR02246 family)
MSFSARWALGCTLIAFCMNVSNRCSFAQEAAGESEIRATSKKIAESFNAGKASDVAALFLSQCELTDEQGTVYRGRTAVKELLTKYFEKYPGVKMETDIDSIRLTGPVAIEEGIRTTRTKEGVTAQVQYMAVYSKSEQGWQLASIRDTAIVAVPTSGDQLQPLDWLVGDWINEGADARVKLSYKWSEDGNFILGEIVVSKNEQDVMKSSHRIGWDPISGKPRSWTFDSDGGFAESTWTQVENAWSIRSTAVMPNGESGSANLTISRGAEGRYVMKGTNRIVGNVLEDDFEIIVVKQPPSPTK